MNFVGIHMFHFSYTDICWLRSLDFVKLLRTEYCVFVIEILCEATLECVKDTMKKAHFNSFCKKNDKL